MSSHGSTAGDFVVGQAYVPKSYQGSTAGDVSMGQAYAPKTFHSSAASCMSVGQPPFRILVLGHTGAGKSSFIREVTGLDVMVSDGADSYRSTFCPSIITSIDLRLHYLLRGTRSCTPYLDKSSQFEFIDTPVFDDPTKSIHDILADIVSWVAGVKRVLYLFPVGDTRVIDEARLDILVFKEMCGAESFPRVIVCSTMWDNIAVGPSHDELVRRNRMRMDEMLAHKSVFEGLIEGGAVYKEYWGNMSDPCREIMQRFANLPTPQTAIERQLRKSRNKVSGTTADSLITDEERRRDREKRRMREQNSHAGKEQGSWLSMIPGRKY